MLKKKQKSTKDLNSKERRFGVVLEHIDSKLGLVVEGHKNLDKKIDRVEKDLGEFRQETHHKFKVVEEMLVKNTEDIEIIKGDLDLIKNLIKRKVDAEEFEALERRVLLLERKAGRSGI